MLFRFIKNIFSQVISLVKSGIFAILPLSLTVIIVKVLWAFLCSSYNYWLAPFGSLSILMIFLGLIVIGFFAQFILSETIKKITHPFEILIDRIPLIRHLYFGIKSVVDFFNVSGNPDLERKVVLIEYPKDGVFHIAFQLGSAKNDFSKVLPESDEKDFVKVFMPTTHITSGYFFLVPKKKVIMTEIGFDEAVKAIVSGGMISPTSLHKKE